MGTIVTTPNVTSASSAAAVVAPTVPQIEQLDGAQLTRNADNSIEVKLDSGEVFKGSADDVVKALAKSQTSTHKYAAGLKEELKTAKQAPAAPVIAATPEEVQLRDYLTNQLAIALGLENGQQLVQNFQKIYNVTTNAGAQMAAASFYSQNPEFPGGEKNVEQLMGVLKQIGGDEENVDHLSAAHAVCLKTGKYQGLSAEQIAALTPLTPKAPPPMIQPSSADTNATSGVQEVNINMTQDQILAAIKANKAAK